MEFQPIYTENNNCQDCYKCIRNCNVKAIKMESHKASIINELCIACGRCTSICPANAKKIRNDVGLVKLLLKENDNVIVSLAPSYVSEFQNLGKEKIIELLKLLGFSKVSETAIGADIITHQTKKWIETKKKGVYYSSCCPSVVELIKKYYPQYSENISPFVSPMLAHGRYLKEEYGSDVKVVFIGPCVAKKKEMLTNPGYVDAVITFQELREWINESNLKIESIPENTENKFYPFEADNGILYPIDGGMIDGIKKDTPIVDMQFMTFSGLQEIIDILNNVDKFNTDFPLFLELMSCKGGCINGYFMSDNKSIAEKRIDVISEFGSSKREENIEVLAKPFNYKSYSCEVFPVFNCVHSEEQIKEALKYVGKVASEDCLNCGGCGYQTCRNFAIALLDGKAERSMCVSYMRNVAQNKATVLLQKMPYGVVIADENLNVIESNHSFAKLMGDEIMKLYEIKPGLVGANLEKLVPFHKSFGNLLVSGEEEIQKDVRYGDKLYSLSIFTIQPHKLVCGIIHNLKVPELRKEEVIKRSRKVIKKNLETVQKIAFLMGENASETESILNSIVESYND